LELDKAGISLAKPDAPEKQNVNLADTEGLFKEYVIFSQTGLNVF